MRFVVFHVEIKLTGEVMCLDAILRAPFTKA
jgi:hypothetical protein